jgi:hypothetical protein
MPELVRVEKIHCPSCGEPARYARGHYKANREVSVIDDFLQLGRVVYARPILNQVLELECGGGHHWTTSHKFAGDDEKESG